MKKAVILLVICCVGASLNGQGSLSLAPQQGTLKRVEQVTPEEKAALQEAADAVSKAQANFEAAKAKVAAAHKMSHESYMEWTSWYEFDGDFILQRFYSNQTSHLTW